MEVALSWCQIEKGSKRLWVCGAAVPGEGREVGSGGRDRARGRERGRHGREGIVRGKMRKDAVE
jgi:hypothetical protein